MRIGPITAFLLSLVAEGELERRAASDEARTDAIVARYALETGDDPDGDLPTLPRIRVTP